MLPRLIGAARRWGRGIIAATQAEMEAVASDAVAATPANLKFHPGIVKAWAKFDISGNVINGFNVASVTDDGTGQWTVNWSSSFADTNYLVFATILLASGFNRSVVVRSVAVGSATVSSISSGGVDEANVTAIFVAAIDN